MANEKRQAGVVELFDPQTGEASLYKKVAARLQEFLEKFPISDGYALVFEAQDANANELGTVRELYKFAIEHNRKLDDFKLAEMSGIANVRFRASLVKDGVTLRNASALKPIRSYKDWERGETAALGRLLELCGFGKSILEDDDEGDVTDQGLQIRKQGGAQTGSTGGAGKAEPKAASESAPAASSEPPEPETPAAEGGDGDKIPEHLIKQLQQVCAQRGLEVPKVKNRKDCTDQIKAIMKRPVTQQAATA